MNPAQLKSLESAQSSTSLSEIKDAAPPAHMEVKRRMIKMRVYLKDTNFTDENLSA